MRLEEQKQAGEAGLITGLQPSTQSVLKSMSADPRTTNALLLILVLCVSGYMPESMTSLCGA